MSVLILLAAALLPAIFLWYYIWKQDPQPEPTSWLVKEGNGLSVAISRALFAVPGHYVFAVLMGYYCSVYHFVDHSPRTAACILLVPMLAHGIYDAIAMSGMVNPYVGSISTFVLIYFCIKMHKAAKTKEHA